MNKGKIGLVSLILLCLILVTALFPGCASSDGGSLTGAMTLFNSAREALATASSFKLTGEGNVTFTHDSQSTSLDYTYQFFYEQKEGQEPLVKMVIGMLFPDSGLDSGSPEEIETDAYITGDTMYIQDPASGQWFYQQMNLGGELTQVGQGISPQSMVKMLEAAQDVEVIEDTESHTRYKLVLDPDKLFEGDRLEELEKALEMEGLSDQEVTEYTEMTKEMTAAMDITVKVNKESGFIEEFEIRIDENMLDFIPPSAFEEGPPPEGSSMTMSIDYRVGDCGEVFNLELPKETADAEPIEEWR